MSFRNVWISSFWCNLQNEWYVSRFLFVYRWPSDSEVNRRQLFLKAFFWTFRTIIFADGRNFEKSSSITPFSEVCLFRVEPWRKKMTVSWRNLNSNLELNQKIWHLRKLWISMKLKWRTKWNVSHFKMPGGV